MQESKQTQQSKEWITQALFELMKVKPYAKITVKDIAEKAGVSRITFYRHFEVKEDILNYRFSMLFEQYQADLENEEIYSIEEALIKCFDYWKKNRTQLELLLKNHLETIIYAPFKNYLETMLVRYHYSTGYNNTQKAFLVGGLYFAMLKFISDDNDLTAEETAESIFGILKI